MISAEIVGGAELLARIRIVADDIERSLGAALLKLRIELETRIQRKLSGEVLNQRSGALVRSVRVEVEAAAEAVRLSATADTPYAAFHEYGFNGAESVRAHLRTAKQAFGRTLSNGPRQMTVQAHSRRVAYPARSFLRTALAEMEPEINATLGTALSEAIRR